MKITFEITELEEQEKAERMLKADDAFCLLFGIDNYCRGIQKYDEGKPTKERILEDIREMIEESNLRDLWN